MRSAPNPGDQKPLSLVKQSSNKQTDPLALGPQGFHNLKSSQLSTGLGLYLLKI